MFDGSFFLLGENESMKMLAINKGVFIFLGVYYLQSKTRLGELQFPSN